MWNTYISKSEGPQASPSLSQELVLRYALRPKGLDSTINDLEGHRGHNELLDSCGSISNCPCVVSTHLCDSNLLQGTLGLMFVDLVSGAQNQQSGPLDIRPRLSNLRENGPWARGEVHEKRLQELRRTVLVQVLSEGLARWIGHS